jgi:hypothetical protein
VGDRGRPVALLGDDADAERDHAEPTSTARLGTPRAVADGDGDRGNEGGDRVDFAPPDNRDLAR